MLHIGVTKIACPVLFTGQVRAPRREAISTIIEGATRFRGGVVIQACEGRREKSE